MLLLSVLILNWKLKRTGKKLDEAIHKGSVADAIIKNNQTANEIKRRNAERSADDRRQRMRNKNYLRSSK